MVETPAAVAAVVLLALVTVVTRVGGVWIMSYLRITPRVETFLRYMAVSVLISIVVPITAAAPPRVWLAVAASVLVSIATGSALWAMLAGVAIAAVVKGIVF